MTSAALLAGVVTPVAVTTVDAAGQGGVKVLESYTVDRNSDQDQNIARIQLTVSKNQILRAGDSVIFELSNKVDLDQGPVYSSAKVLIDDKALTGAYKGTTTADTFQFEFITASNGNTNQVKVTYNGGAVTNTGNTGFTQPASNDAIELTKDLAIVLDVRGKVQGITGDITVNTLVSNNSAFPKISGAAITATSKGELQLSAKNTRSSNNKFEFDLRLNESVAGALSSANIGNSGTIKLKLPSGFKWDSRDKENLDPVLGGNGKLNGVSYSLGSSDRELTITIPAYNTAAAKAALLEVSKLKFQVDDERVAKKGDVKATVSGSIDADVSELLVGKYGDYQTATEVAEVKEVLSGKKEQELGKVILKEELVNTWIPGRTVTITLPEYARWDRDETNSQVKFDYTAGSATFDKGNIQYIGSDGRTLKLTVKEAAKNNGRDVLRHEDQDPSIAEITGLNIYVKPGYEGDVKADIAGSAGVSIKGVTIAKAIKPFTMTASNLSDVIIGSQGQEATADLVIKEVVASAFGDGTDHQYARVTLPQGVKVAARPEVKVTKGDLVIADATYDNPVYGESYIQFRIIADSTEASEVTIKGLNLTLDRTVPVGDVIAKLKGDAVNEWNSEEKKDGVITQYGHDTKGWEDASAATAVVAKVITPAPADATLGEAVFTIGSTSYTVAGETKTMDVAPFVEGGRTYLPLRYVAEAVGVKAQDVLYDNATATVTILKGDRIASTKLGSKTLSVNGQIIPMDVPVKTVNGRTVLPVRYVAQALGRDVEWDQTTQTATVK